MSHGNQGVMIKIIINDFINQFWFNIKLFSIINIILFPLFTISNKLNFHEGKMAEKISKGFQKQTKLEYNGKKRRPKIQKLQPIEYVDLIPPKEEK